MALTSFFRLIEFYSEVDTAWTAWGENFSVDGQSRSDVAAKARELEALEAEVRNLEADLRLAQTRRNHAVAASDAFSVRLRLAVLAAFPKNSTQVAVLPKLRQRQAGAPTKRALTRRANTQIKRDAAQNEAREALKAELRAEIEQEKARLN